MLRHKWIIFLMANLVCHTLGCDRESTSALHSSGRGVGAPRGLALLDKHVMGRVFDLRDSNTKNFSLAKIAGEEVFALRDLMGRNLGNGQFSGSELNPFGMLTWQRIVDELAFSLAASCQTQSVAEDSYVVFEKFGRFKLAPKFATELAVTCFESDSAKRATALRAMWHQLVGYGFSNERDIFVSTFAAMAPGTKSVNALFWAMLLHPYLFLEL